MSEWGGETIQIFEILQPICSRRYGDAFGSPTGGCTAQLGVTGDRKCYNTRVTCQDPSNYSPGILILRFARNQSGLLQYGNAQVGSPAEAASNVIPSIVNLSTTPASLNLAAMDRSASPLGQREVVNVELQDHKHSDLFVDPYRLERQQGDAGVATHLSLPGIAGNYSSTPDTGVLDITGDIDIRIFMAPDDWTPATSVAVLAKWRTTATDQRSYLIQLITDGTIKFFWSTTGANQLEASSTVATGFANGSAHWIRVTLDVNDGASPGPNNIVTFYTSDTGETWTQLGAVVTTVGVTSIFSSTAVLEIGTQNTGAFVPFVGNIHRALVYDGINGTLVADFDASDAGQGETSLTDSTGKVWTVNQSGTPSAELVNADTFDPYERGTFWGKWLARNPYHSNYDCRVREGYVGDMLDDMRVRNYIVDRVDGPVNGSVKIVAKDLFSKIEARKAVAPTASRGELFADITSVATTATLSPTGIGALDYPAMAGSPSEFYVAIGDEVIRCSRSGDTLNLLERGALDTVAAAHDEEDLVQWVLVYTSQLAQDITYDLLTTYSEIPASLIDLTEWDAQAEQLTQLYTARIAEPVAVNELIGELAEQAGFTIWPDPVTQMIKFVALRSVAPSPTVNDDAWIIDGSFSSKLQIAKRASEVWVYYGQKSPIEKIDDRRNFRSRLVVVDTDAESTVEYGVPAIREIFSRWIPQFGRDFAEDTANRIIAMFRDPPIEAEFSIHVSRDGELEPAQFFFLEVAEIQDDTGAVTPISLAVTQLRRGENDITVRAQEVSFATIEADTGERVIYIENDIYNLNLRTIHDSLYSEPIGGSPSEQVRFIIVEGITVGSTSTSTPAMRTGSWPAGLDLILENRGRIQGKGGGGGNAGLSVENGSPGGDALLVERSLQIENEGVGFLGQIWAGGGGGGGALALLSGNPDLDGAGGGGGGSGFNGGNGGNGYPNGTNGQPGTSDSGGVGGTWLGNSGGDGGGPGLIGGPSSFGGGTPGAPGNAINGMSYITWVGSPTGDIRGTTI